MNNGLVFNQWAYNELYVVPELPWNLTKLITYSVAHIQLIWGLMQPWIQTRPTVSWSLGIGLYVGIIKPSHQWFWSVLWILLLSVHLMWYLEFSYTVIKKPYPSHTAIWPQVNDFTPGFVTLLLFVAVTPAKYPLNDLEVTHKAMLAHAISKPETLGEFLT